MNANAYLLDFLPVLIGAAVMLLLRSFRFLRRRIRIEIGTDLAALENRGNAWHATFPLSVDDVHSIYGAAALGASSHLLVSDKTRIWNGFVSECDELRHAVFMRLVDDRLITSGRPAMHKGYPSSAFSMFGIIDSERALCIHEYLSRWKKERLTIFTEERKGFAMSLLMYGECNGILLAYVLLRRLEFISG